MAYSRDYVGIQLFDHGRALLGRDSGLGTERLLKYADRPVVSHCLAPHVTMSQPFVPWAERIASVHDDVIRDLVAAGVACGLTGDEADETASFLIQRKSRIMDLAVHAAAWSFDQSRRWAGSARSVQPIALIRPRERDDELTKQINVLRAKSRVIDVSDESLAVDSLGELMHLH